MSDVLRTAVEVRWPDLDANRHVRSTAFSDYAAHARLSFLGARGFPPERFTRIGLGPIYFREETVFRREVHLGETLAIEARSDGLAPDGSRWRIVCQVLRDSGEEAARVTVEGAWMDLTTRGLSLPPQELADAMRDMPRTDTFEELRSVIR